LVSCLLACLPATQTQTLGQNDTIMSATTGAPSRAVQFGPETTSLGSTYRDSHVSTAPTIRSVGMSHKPTNPLTVREGDDTIIVLSCLALSCIALHYIALPVFACISWMN
jgi:hypothetical protein